MALIHELAAPYPMTEVTRSELLDRVYETLSDESATDRRERVEWALMAGGEVR